jgi:NADH-quinone oxidoreductase subunit J
MFFFLDLSVIFNIIIILISSFGIFFVKNPVHSLIFLVLIFLNSVFIFFSLNAFFFGIVFLIIYVGAIMVLFLFVIMMLNIRHLELKSFFLQYLPMMGFILIIFFFEIGYFFF